MEHSKVELLALIKNYNKLNNDKIKNADKMKKDELIMICNKYHMINGDGSTEIEIDLNNVSKHHLQKDVEVHFIDARKSVPIKVMQMKKAALIKFMHDHDIRHMSKNKIAQILQDHERLQMNKLIIVNNIIKYDNIDVSAIDDANLEQFIIEKQLHTDIDHLQEYSVLLHDLYVAYDKFCNKTGLVSDRDKIRSFPKILNKIADVL